MPRIPAKDYYFETQMLMPLELYGRDVIPNMIHMSLLLITPLLF